MLRLPHRNLRAAAFSPTADRIATVGLDGVLRLWDLATGDTLVQLEANASGVSAVTFAGDSRLVTGAQSGELVTWDLDTCTAVRRAKLPYAVSSVLVHAQHGSFAGVSDLQHGNYVYRLEEDGGYSVVVECIYGSGRWTLAASPDGRHLAALCVDGHWMEFVGLWLVELPSGRVLDGAIGGSLNYSPGRTWTNDTPRAGRPEPPWTRSDFERVMCMRTGYRSLRHGCSSEARCP
ncbi:hypothetical protein AKJ09_05190 [Labilithrix luteola]|uniref:Uncharacterized protein n=1 Tax=Labilithrix luteola TaxID=1391654 RepID=A0A0K1PYQ9_9BACT|nr:hypothetical protein [Labilithrix luteola]AKU98526.1 hypothetical protein AKJ09_05190 [Labilithrix luteola]